MAIAWRHRCPRPRYDGIENRSILQYSIISIDSIGYIIEYDAIEFLFYDIEKKAGLLVGYR